MKKTVRNLLLAAAFAGSKFFCPHNLLRTKELP